MSKFDGVLAKIQSLLNLADHPETPEHEAALARTRAESMMLKYRIEESQLAETNTASGIEPIEHDMVLCPWQSTFRDSYYGMAYWIAKHTGVRCALKTVGEHRVLVMVGYESDIRYAEILYTSARTIFGARLEPSVDPKLNDMQNVYRLRNAGIERNRIARMLWNLDTHSAHARVGKLYKLACEELGEDAVVASRRVNAKTYRKEYAQQFVTTLYMRLSEARNAAESEAGAVVPLSRAEKVDEAFYERYPYLRPAPVDSSKKTKARKPRAMSWSAYEKEMRRQRNPAVQAAKERGKAAASEVELGRVTPAKRVESEDQWVDRSFREMTN